MTLDTPDCRLCGRKDDMVIKNYSQAKNKAWWRCITCQIETEVPLNC